MTHRHLLLIAAGPAALVQIAFVAALSAVTDGCFCAVTGVGQPEPSPFLWWLIHAGSAPLAAIPAPYFPLPFSVGDWISALLFASINSLFWVAGLYVLLSGIALLCRIRVVWRGAGPRLRLRSLAAVRPSWMAAGVIVLAASSLWAGASYRAWWLEQAEQAARATVDAIRDGRPLPHSPYGISCSERDCSSMVSRGSYVLAPRERPMLGTSRLDAFVPPRVWRAEAVFQNGVRYRLGVYRLDGTWHVSTWIAGPERTAG